MPYLPLKLPPGCYHNGTKYQSAGQWYSANLVRWSEGAMQAIGGWENVEDGTNVDIDAGERISGLLVWRDNDGGAYVAYGTKDSVYTLTGGSEVDITPDGGITAGLDDAAMTSGAYGEGAYGVGLYGTGSESASALTEAQSWQFDTFGEWLVACAYSDGVLYKWDLGPSNDLTAISNAPTGCRGLVVTPERFLVALASDSDGRLIAWSDQEDITVWTPTATNQAGDFTLPGGGEVICGRRGRNETLIWTDLDLFAMRYLGGTLVYSFAQVGASCGIIGPHAVASVDGRFFWMGQRGFYHYDGSAKPVPCGISDAIFTDLNRVQRSKIAAIGVSEFHEVWFAYPSLGSQENDRVVCFNYLENHWSGPWAIERTVGVDRGALGYPVLADAQGALYYHESGTSYLDTDGSTPLVPSAESGPVEIGKGDRVMTIRRVVPDENTLGQVTASLFTSFYPTDTETETPFTIEAPSDVRVTGRQVRIKIEQDQPGWRWGIPRLEVVPRGLR